MDKDREGGPICGRWFLFCHMRQQVIICLQCLADNWIHNTGCDVYIYYMSYGNLDTCLLLGVLHVNACINYTIVWSFRHKRANRLLFGTGEWKPWPGGWCSWVKWRYVQQANPKLTTTTDIESPSEYVSRPLAWCLLTAESGRAIWPAETQSKATAAACWERGHPQEKGNVLIFHSCPCLSCFIWIHPCGRPHVCVFLAFICGFVCYWLCTVDQGSMLLLIYIFFLSFLFMRMGNTRQNTQSHAAISKPPPSICPMQSIQNDSA